MADIETKEGAVLADIRKAQSRFRTSRRIPGWALELTREALERFEAMSWPTPQEEEWRRTDVTNIDFGRYRQSVMSTNTSLSAIAETHASDAGSGMAGKVLFSDSKLVAADQHEELKERGVALMSLEEALFCNEAILKPVLKEELESIDNRFQAWNLSLVGDGLFLYIPPFVEIGEPFFIEAREDGKERSSALRVVVVLDRGARAKVIYKTIGSGHEDILCNTAVHLSIGESAGLEIYRLQNLSEHSLCVSHDVASVARDGALRSFDAIFGGRLVKSRLECNLEDRGSEAYLNAVYFARGQQHMDIRSVQRHRAPQANSRAFYKGAVKDAGRAVYQGLIEVSPLASKTDAYLTNKNLILNDGARADSIPSLKINTNDVKCSHGSTTGRINDEEVFYLMSRGLARREAEGMLIQGYFEELLEGTPANVGDHLRNIIQSILVESG